MVGSHPTFCRPVADLSGRLDGLLELRLHQQRPRDGNEPPKPRAVADRRPTIGDHWQEVRSVFLAEVLERGLLRATHADEVSDIAEELLHWFQRLRP